MKFQNKIALILCTVVMTVSFLHPFSGRTVRAEETVSQLSEEQTGENADDETTEKKETGKREMSGKEEPDKQAESQKTETDESGTKEKAETGPIGDAEETETDESETAENTEEEAEGESGETESGQTQEGEEKDTGQGGTEETGDGKIGESDDDETAGEETGDAEETETGESAVVDGEETSEENEEVTDSLKVQVVQRIAMMKSTGARSSIGIDPDHPRDGQQNRYEYSRSEETWTVPAAGEYDIYCYGAAGGDGRGWAFSYTGSSGSSQGSKGAVRACRVHLSKGMVFGIHAGGAGGSVGNISYNNKIYGTAGWSDGNKGTYASTGGDDDNNNGSLGTGGGGGSSYVTYQGAKIISAAGGTGGSAWYESPRGSSSKTGGAGGGVTVLNAASGIEWNTGELNMNDGAANTGDGYIIIRAVSVVPDISLQAEDKWTNKDVIITALSDAKQENLPEGCFSWETDQEGNPVWTDRNTFTVDRNGTYTCKIRDKEGKIGEASIVITKIDKLGPTVEVEQSVRGWTREDIVLTASVQDTEGGGEYGCSDVPDRRYSWQDDENGNPVWTDDKSRTVTGNGTYICRGRDNAGNVTETEIRITQIDRTPPEVTCEHPRKWYEGTVNVRLSAKDLQPDGTEGCGLDAAPYSIDGIHFSSLAQIQVENEGVYSVWVRDSLGNIKETRFSFTHSRRETEDKGKKDRGKREPQPSQPSEAPEMILENTDQLSDVGDEGAMPVQEYTENMEDAAEKRVESPVLTPSPVSAEEPEKMQKKPKKLPVMQEKREEEAKPETIEEEISEKRPFNWKKAVLYSVWMAVILCGLIWLLFCLLFEHVTVYRKDDDGRYRKAGRCAIIRKKEYKQINLLRLMEKGEDRDYKVCFSRIFVLLHRNDKVLLRTCHGVELRNVEKEIEILTCNP